MENELELGDQIVVWVEPTGDFDGLTPYYILNPDHPSIREVEVACAPGELPDAIEGSFGFAVLSPVCDEGGLNFFECEVAD